MKNETRKLYSKVFGIFLPNVIKNRSLQFQAILYQSWCAFWDTV